jgi:hypothetical protein
VVLFSLRGLGIGKKQDEMGEDRSSSCDHIAPIDELDNDPSVKMAQLRLKSSTLSAMVGEPSFLRRSLERGMMYSA